MQSPGDIFQEWRVADRQAHSYEQEVVRASLRSLSDGTPGPSEEDRKKARRLREVANDLFHLAMDEMKTRAEKARRGQ